MNTDIIDRESSACRPAINDQRNCGCLPASDIIETFIMPTQTSSTVLCSERQKPLIASAKHPGFTLVELLVVITIILTLAAMSLATFTKLRARADNILAIENMRQIGVAIASYASDNDHLPTFMDAGVSAAISTANLYTQAYVLQPYLGLAEPTSTVQHAEIFRAPGLKADNMNNRKHWYEVTCYAMYSADYLAANKSYLPKGMVTDIDGEDVGPFGRVVNNVATPGWKMAQLDAALARYTANNGGRIATISKVPAMFEINTKYPSVRGSWPWTTPKKPLRGDHVNVLYFDWRVDAVTPKFLYSP